MPRHVPQPLTAGLERACDFDEYRARRGRAGKAASAAQQRGEEFMAWRRTVAAAALVAATITVSGFTPQNVECIAPANPGGGWDFTCRQIGRLLGEQQHVSGTVQVTNMAGGVG